MKLESGVANSAQWVAWGVVQAKVPGMDKAFSREKTAKVDLENARGQNPDRGLNQAGAAGMSPDTSTQTKRVQSRVHGINDEGLVAEALRDRNDLPHEEDEEEFDYLGYAQERAMFFWGDLISLGIVQKHDLPADLLPKIKIVEY
jgi:choline kinase